MKLEAPGPQALFQLPEALNSLGFVVEESGHQILVDRYFDTPEGHIAQSGWALRFRAGESPDQFMRTYKSLNANIEDGVFLREEREQLVSEIESTWEGHDLKESFKLFQDRWWWLVAKDGLQVKASYDLVQWRKKTNETILRDDAIAIELELTKGNTAELMNLSKQITTATGWQEATWSKFARGLKL